MDASLSAGTKLGRYEIRSKIGAGGMGEVYLARDEKLHREVAIKVLPAGYATDKDRLARFEQEAQAAGALNHPNILAVYDVGANEGSPYVVSELLEGQTLRQRIGGTAIPQRRAIEYAQQIAKGLAAAHEKGIIHRDLKPDNIFVTSDGRVKILDFGLAKLTQLDGGGAQTDISTRRVNTDPGVVMGTVGYMSPEQLKGETVDQRSDIFSFGAILYEMLSGERAFHRRSTAETMSAILKEDPPDLSHTNQNISPALERLVNHCLEKDPEARFHSTRDLGFALEAISGGSAQTNTSVVLPSRSSRNWERLTWIGITALLLLLTVAALFFSPFRQQQTAAGVVRFNVTLPEKANFFFDVETHNLAVSPDGRKLAFIAASEGKHSLWLYSVDELSPQPVKGTDGAYSPFWSPDGRHIAFFAQGTLRRLDVAAQSIQTVCSLSGEIDTVGSWGRDGVILFNDQFNDFSAGQTVLTDKSSSAIFSVPASGGTAAILTKSPKFRPYWVHFLPDGKRFLFYGEGAEPAGKGIYAASLDSPDGKLLLHVGLTRVEYIPPGYLLYAREGSLIAQPFDEKNLRITGEPVTVVARITYFDKTGWAEFSSSESALVYAGTFPSTRMVWLDRAGRESAQVGEPGTYYNIQLSPNGGNVAFTTVDERTSSGDIWIQDLQRGTRSRFAFGPTDDSESAWSPDGARLAFFSCCEGASTLYIKGLNDTSKGQSPLPAGFRAPYDWSADGRYILYSENDPTTNRDIWVLPVDSDQKPYPLIHTQFNESFAQLSPNGRWVAYLSNETGNDELYVTSFENPSKRWRVSTAGAAQPRWRRDGTELFYLDGNKHLITVPVKAGDTFETGEAVSLFKADSIFENSYDVSSDGQRFLVSTSESTARSMPFTLVLNWTLDLKR